MQELQLVDFSEDITLCKSSEKYVFLAMSLSACQSIGMQAYFPSSSPCFLLHRFSSVDARCADIPFKVSR